MKLQSIRLHPFAGINDTTYNFNDGLTIIYGPNEHGKSTVAKAIQQILFLETNLTPARKKNELQDVLPVTGGDTIQITLKFIWKGIEYTLEKKWGATNSVVLRSSDGETITDNNAVQKKILDMLPTNEAVVRQVLISSQSQLAYAVDNLSSDVETSLSEKLRGAILNAGEISATVLENTIRARETSYFAKWDEVNNRPEGGPGHGLSNPWKKGIGNILNVWYQWQEALAKVSIIDQYETDSNRLQTELNRCNEELKEVNIFLEKHKTAYEAVNKRIALDADIQNKTFALKSFTDDSKRWPNIQAEKEQAERAKITIDDDIKKLNVEITQARKKENARQDISKLEQIKTLQKSLEIAEVEKSSLQIILIDDVKSAQLLHQNINNYQMLIQGQKLNFGIDPTTNGDIKIIHSGGQEETINFVAGQKIDKEVSGSIKFNWQGLSFSLQSANQDIPTLEASLSEAQNELDTLLKKYAQPTLEKLITAEKQYVEAIQKVNQAKANFNAVLGNDTIDDLSQRSQEALALPGTRDLKVLDLELQQKNTIFGNYQASIERLQNEITALLEKYQSQDNLRKNELELLLAKSQSEKALASLPPLPDGYESAIKFQEEYIKYQSRREVLADEKSEKKLAIGALIDPEQPLSEAKENARLLCSKFQQTLDEGKSYRRIRQVLQEILDSADENAFVPLHSKTQDYLNRLSSGRFKHIPFNITQPQELQGDGVSLPVELLSKGTKDILALSLRLATAEVYLAESSGFVMMDDPLVDMDRNRREASAKVLQEFSQMHQTIIFTCHEEHENLLNTDMARVSLN